MELSRMDVPQAFAACSRVFSKPDVASKVMGLQFKSDLQCRSVSARSPANQSSRGPVAKLYSLPPHSGGAPRASSVTGKGHQ